MSFSYRLANAIFAPKVEIGTKNLVAMSVSSMAKATALFQLYFWQNQTK
jgi:hypothetical protein